MSRELDDLTGHAFLNISVLARVGISTTKHTTYLCQYDCGHKRVLTRDSIIDIPARGFFPCRECPRPESKTQRAVRELHERTIARDAAHKCPDCGADSWPRKSTRGVLGRCPTCRIRNSQGESRGVGERIHIFGVAWERVSRARVMKRDKVCQHCGTEAEPQLDHILPMKHGGAHSYANTQRLCRTCNRRKGSKIELEPRLAGVVDLTPFRVAKNSPGTPYTSIPEEYAVFLKRREEERNLKCQLKSMRQQKATTNLRRPE